MIEKRKTEKQLPQDNDFIGYCGYNGGESPLEMAIGSASRRTSFILFAAVKIGKDVAGLLPLFFLSLFALPLVDNRRCPCDCAN